MSCHHPTTIALKRRLEPVTARMLEKGLTSGVAADLNRKVGIIIGLLDAAETVRETTHLIGVAEDIEKAADERLKRLAA